MPGTLARAYLSKHAHYHIPGQGFPALALFHLKAKLRKKLETDFHIDLIMVDGGIVSFVLLVHDVLFRVKINHSSQ